MAKSPGRNDPCPCGSGRKFKKCHLDGIERWQRIAADPQLDATEAKLAFALAMEGQNLLREVSTQGDALQREYFGTYPDETILTQLEAEGALLKWLNRLEVELGRLAETNSRYFWLFLTQRVRPTTRRFTVTELTVRLYRQVLKLAILKYGADSGTPFTNLPADYDPKELNEWVTRLDDATLPRLEPKPNTSVVPVSVSLSDIFNALLMERLAHDFCGAAALLRRCWKGGRLPISEGRPGNALHDADADWLIDLYDERRRFTRVLSEFGSIVSPEFAPERESKLLALIPEYNLDEKRLPLVWPSVADGSDDFSKLFRNAEYCPNYLVVPANLEDYLGKAKRFRSALDSNHGFPAEDLVCFLVALSYRELAGWKVSPRRHLQLHQRGYTVVVDEETFLRDLAGFYSDVSGFVGSAVSEDLAREKVAAIASALRYEGANLDSIDLWSRSGLKLILPTDRGVLIDHHVIPDILGDFFKPLARMSGDVGRMKGEDFEREVAFALENEVAGARVVWRGERIARGTPREREIDLGVIKGDALFVLECKAHALDPAFDRGEPDALEKRQELNEGALSQADTLAQFLAENPKGHDYEVEEGVLFIVSAAISPFPEYIHERSENLFLSERVPRVCTPEEIADFIKDFEAADYRSQPWLLEIQRPPDAPWSV